MTGKRDRCVLLGEDQPSPGSHCFRVEIIYQ